MMNIKNCGEGNSGRLLCSDSLLTWKRRSLSSMHKDTKWAKQIIAMQEEDGKWGSFHTLSVSSGRPITTEQALRRLERLGAEYMTGGGDAFYRKVGYGEGIHWLHWKKRRGHNWLMEVC